MKQTKLLRSLSAAASLLALTACSYSSYSSPIPQATAPQQGQADTPATSGGLRQMADDLANAGRHDAAIPLYRHLASSGGDQSTRLALAKSLDAHGEQAEALAILTALARDGQLGADGWYALGKTHLALGHFDEALNAFDRADTLDGADGRVRSGRGIALAALGRADDSLNAFNGVTDPAGLSNMALVLAASDKPALAINILEPLVKGGLGGVQARQNLALAYLLDNREADAFQLARLDLDPATVDDTFTFYRSLKSLSPDRRMQALVLGVTDPAWSSDEAGNLAVNDSPDRQAAAKRLITPPEPMPAPVAEPAPAPVDRSSYELTEVPPLLEPEGWALQIAAYRTIKELMRGWTILYRQSGDLLENVPPRRSEVDFGDRVQKPTGFFYRLNAGPLKTLAEARTLCKALKERGTDCWIRPPEVSEGKLPDTAKDTPAPNENGTPAGKESHF